MTISFKDFNKQINEEQLDEISKSTAKSYVDKKMDKIYSADKAPGKEKAKKDIQSLQRAHERIVGNKPTSEKVELTLEDYSLEELDDFIMSEEFEQLDELEKKTLRSYRSKAATQRKDALYNKDLATYAGLLHTTKSPTPENIKKGKNIKKAIGDMNKIVNKRSAGIAMATKKLNKEDVELEEALKGNQDKLDVDRDGKIERSDLKKLRAKKDDIVVNKGEQVKENEGCGKKMYREFVEEIEEIVAEAKKDDYWDFKDLKPTPTTRKVAGTRYGGSAQKDEPEDDDNDDKPAVKRGRGRPAGSKSGARQKGNGNNYGGLAIHSLNLPSKK